MLDYNQNYYQQYFENNFNEELIPGHGIEACLDWASTCFRPGRWIDVGAGPCSMFWSVTAPINIDAIALADLSRVPLDMTAELIRTRNWPPAYIQALHYLGKTEDHLNTLANAPLKIHEFNAFEKWPDVGMFNSISAFGLAGIAESTSTLDTLLTEAKDHLAPGGALFGASWVFSDTYAMKLKGRKQYLSSLAERLATHGYEDIQTTKVSLTADENYSGIMLFKGRA